ncbi:hypothetical protein IKS57_02975 [bacterium]|nr:hypothetical protein [bacterium]
MLLRNYLNNSEFRYEYKYKYGQSLYKKRVHYPDFIVENNNDIYICEIKSQLDYDKTKTEELEKAYLEYSKLNNYHYLILKHKYNDKFGWTHYYKGELYQDKESDELSSIFN